MENDRPFLRRVRRTAAAILWFGIDGGWIYYVVAAGYAVLVGAALWLLTRHGLLPFLAACVVLLDGMTTLLFLLHRWWTRRLGGPSGGAPHMR